MFCLGAALAAFAGVMGAPFLSVYPGLDFEMLPLALIVVILGGTGSLLGALVGSFILGFLYNFGQAMFPDLAYVILFLPMLLVLVLRPQGLFGRVVRMSGRLRYAAIAVALRAARSRCRWWVGNTYYINIASQILLFAVFALALNVLVGYAGLVSLGHAGLFAIAGYTAALLLQSGYGHLAANSAAIVVTLAASAIFAVLALRSTGIGFLMITLALGQIIWGIAYRWASLTGGDNGVNVTTRPAPFGLSLVERAVVLLRLPDRVPARARAP